MPICGAILKYGLSNFSLYILEVIPDHEVKNLPSYEHKWERLVKPSYNIAAIIDTFVGENHPRYGKTVSQHVRDKISATLKGRTLSESHRQHIIQGVPKKPVYCYDAYTHEFVVKFDGYGT